MSGPSDCRLTSLAARALADTPAEVPAEAIESVVAGHLARREVFLDAVRRHGSPLYVIETGVLRERASRFVRAFQEAMPTPVRVYYAVKSNNHPAVAGTFVDGGLGLDVSSGRELQLALDAGASDIIFSGPGKTDDELALAVEHAGLVTVLMDSFSELQRLEAVASRNHATVDAGVRLTTNPNGLWRKFGIPLPELGRFLSAARPCTHVRMRGLQFHTSWNLAPAAQTDFLRSLGQTLGELPASLTAPLRFVDIGGGYWPEQGEWLQAAGTSAGAVRHLLAPEDAPPRRRYWMPGTPIEAFARELAGAVREHLLAHVKVDVHLEPGRWLCHHGMHILMTVVDRKADDLVITDAGGNAVGWERYETDFFPVINLTRPAMTERACDIHGCLCTPHDIWGYWFWGEDIQPGDVLLVPSQGAYTYSLRQDFIKPLPAVAIL
ncbi:MAG TPA: decarboxylase [Phycisphaerae bacterium]|nr:decarboxylase [Phycisphaerae bacterium]